MKKIILPLLVLGIAWGVVQYLKATAPEAKKIPPRDRSPVVEVVPLESRDYTIQVASSGVVKARTRSDLVAEVSGRVVKVSEAFQEGAWFTEGDVLLELDRQTILQAQKIAESELVANQAALQQLKTEEEVARKSLQLARKNLQVGRNELRRKHGLLDRKLISSSQVDLEEQKVIQLEQQVTDLSGKLSVFASRKNVSQAQINAATAKLEREQLNLERTRITAPFTGRVLSKQVDVGQYVTAGKLLGSIYATDYAEVKLPLSLSQFELLGMPELSPGQPIVPDQLPLVRFQKVSGNAEQEWSGRVTRSSAALDENSRQISVIARIDEPFAVSEQRPLPLRVGQYVRANIDGRAFENVFVLPMAAVRNGSEILFLDKGKVHIEKIKPQWTSDTEVVIAADPQWLGRQLIVTALAGVKDGMAAKTVEQAKKAAAKRSKKGKEEKRQKPGSAAKPGKAEQERS